MTPDGCDSLIISYQFKSQGSVPGLIISLGQIHHSSAAVFFRGPFRGCDCKWTENEV